MTLATGLVLAIAVGAIAQNSGMLMDFFGGGSDSEIATQDDQFTVMAGRSQILDVLSNDEKSGDITLLGRPTCGLIRKTDENSLEFYDSGNCEGDVEFAYCVEGDSGC
ncbi:MAG TPA: hypothetical protein VLA51_01050, partial [Paracoccaceae bacterium]|nr:hypothetical protein [Paracoccaceae bacterium]